MARPVTKGSMIPIRLPLTADREVRRRAESAGTSPGRYLAARITASLATREEAPTASCDHKNRTALAGGMARCDACGTLRRADGVWG